MNGRVSHTRRGENGILGCLRGGADVEILCAGWAEVKSLVKPSASDISGKHCIERISRLDRWILWDRGQLHCMVCR